MKILLALSILLNIALVDTTSKKHYELSNLQNAYLDAIDYIKYLEQGIIE